MMYRYEPDSGCGLKLNEARDKGSQLAHERRHNNTTSRDLRIAYCSPPLTGIRINTRHSCSTRGTSFFCCVRVTFFRRD